MMTLTLFAGLAGGAAFATEGPDMRVGAAIADISPVVGLGEPDVWLAGYGPKRRATGAASPLSARAVSLNDGTRRVVVVALDLVGLFRDDVVKIRAACAKARPDRPVDYLIVCCTHTHAGPDTIGIWGPLPKSGVDPAYMARVRERTVRAVADAVAAERPARLRIVRTEMPDLITDTRKPFVIDQGFWVIAADGADDGRAIATLTNWGIHPEVLDSRNTLVSADFPGVLRSSIEAARGGTALHVSGAVGGLTVPAFPERDDRGEAFDEERNRRVDQYGRMVAARAVAALAKAEPLSGRLDFRTAEIDLPLANLHYLLGFTLGTIVRESVDIPKADPARPDVLRQAFLKTELGVLRIGDAAIAVIPGEIYPELVVGGIQDPQDPDADFPGAPHEPLIHDALAGARHNLVFGLANDEIGYIIPKSQWDRNAPHCYGRKTPQYGEDNSCGPEVAPLLCAEFRRLAASLPMPAPTDRPRP